MSFECCVKPIAQPREAFGRKLDRSLLAIGMSGIGIAFATRGIPLRRREGIGLKCIHQFVERDAIRNRAINEFRVVDTDVS